MTSKQPATKPEGAAAGMETGWMATGHLLSGVAVWAVIGGLVDWWLGIPSHICLVVGMLVGAAAAIYLIVKRLGSS
jgi:F0F1-type ATP synthase assembly protein I